MKINKSPLIEMLSFAAIAGNIIFVLWILYNGIHENFKGTIVEKFSYLSLLGLLVLNAFLLIRKAKDVTE
jgi:hypothetical protein